MDNGAFADLDSVDPATVWKSEPAEFVPWLSSDKRLERLGRTLGLDLEPVGRETSVGRFRADLVCRDRGTGARVVIEAQLGPSDHSHLGQLLTYAMGLPARTLVWLATRFHAEHCAVVEGLNEVGDGKLRCFAGAMDLWKIGKSPTAPQFTVFSAPQDWPGVAAATPGRRKGVEVAPTGPAGWLPSGENPIMVGRIRRGLTVEQLAKAAGISRAYLSHLETGRYRGSPETRAAIERALAMPSDEPARPAPARARKPESGGERKTEA